MDPDLRQRMKDYYNERATEYEEAYTLGTGTASIENPGLFKSEAIAVSKVVEKFGHGRLIDIACGTGYWLPFYVANVSHVTFLDQSENAFIITSVCVEYFGPGFFAVSGKFV